MLPISMNLPCSHLHMQKQNHKHKHIQNNILIQTF